MKTLYELRKALADISHQFTNDWCIPVIVDGKEIESITLNDNYEVEIELKKNVSIKQGEITKEAEEFVNSWMRYKPTLSPAEIKAKLTGVWVSTNEKFPEDNEEVFVLSTFGGYKARYDKSDNEFYHVESDSTVINVLYWMRIPELEKTDK